MSELVRLRGKIYFTKYILCTGLIFKDAADLQGYLATTGLPHVAVSNCGTADNPDWCRLS